MTDVTLTFNGFDFSPMLSNYNVSYEQNSPKIVTALDGTEYVGNLKFRTIITFCLRPMTDAQEAAHYAALSAMVASCTYTDAATNSDRTETMRVTSNPEYAFAHRAADGNRYYKSDVITLRGVTCRA